MPQHAHRQASEPAGGMECCARTPCSACSWPPHAMSGSRSEQHLRGNELTLAAGGSEIVSAPHTQQAGWRDRKKRGSEADRGVGRVGWGN
eukprot:2844716-Rhodomonas_salina.1